MAWVKRWCCLSDQATHDEASLDISSPGEQSSQVDHGSRVDNAQGVGNEQRVDDAQCVDQGQQRGDDRKRDASVTPGDNLKDRLEELLRVLKKAVDGTGPQASRNDLETLRSSRDAAETIIEQLSHRKISQTAKDVAEELQNLLPDILKGVGIIHWTLAGLQVMAYVLDRVTMVKTNSEDCLNCLEAMYDLGKRVVKMYPKLAEGNEKLEKATCLIMEVAIAYCRYAKDGRLKRFFLAGGNSADFSSLRKKISEFSVTFDRDVTEKIESNTTALMRLSSNMPLSSHEPQVVSDKVGLDKKVDAVLELLKMTDENAIGAVVLHGMGGIGKSTLGTAVSGAVYAKLHFKDREYAMVEVGEAPDDQKICACQKELLLRLSGQKYQIGSCLEGKQALQDYFKKCKSHLLLFIDNIFLEQDLKKLMPDELRLPPGSRIIMTSRDVNVNATLKEKNIACELYFLDALDTKDATQLLCKQVFSCLLPPLNRQKHVVDLLSICGGLPLALVVVGKYLRRNETCKNWSYAIASLRKGCSVNGLQQDRLNVSLMFSYNQLDKDCKEAFLDITCLFRDAPWAWVENLYGEKMAILEGLALAKKIINCRGIHHVQVHDLLVALGQSQQPGKRISWDGKNGFPPFLQSEKKKCCEGMKGLVLTRWSGTLPAQKWADMCGSLRILVLKETHLGGCSENPEQLRLCIIKNADMPYRNVAKLQQLQVLVLTTTELDDLELWELSCELKVLNLCSGQLKGLPANFGGLQALQTLDLSSCEQL